MGSTYWITGVQIGILLAELKEGNTKEAEKLLQKIMDEQVTGMEARKSGVVN